MATDNLGITDIENKQIDALKAGASREDLQTMAGAFGQDPSTVPTLYNPQESKDYGIEDANQDFEIPQTHQTEQHLPIARNYASYNTYIKAGDPGEVEEKYNTNLQAARYDEEGFKSEIALDQLKKAQEGLMAYISESSSGEVQEMQEDIPQYIEDVQKESGSPLAAEMALARQLMPAETPEELIKEKAFTIAAQTEMAKVLEGHTGVDAWINYAGFLLPDLSWDLSQVEGIDDMTSAINNFQSLEPEERISVLKPLIEELMVAQDDNELKVLATIQNFIGAEGANQLARDLAIDKIGVAFSVADVGTLAAGLNRAVRTANAVKVANTAEEAGVVNAAALNDVETASRINVSQDVATVNSTFFPNEQILTDARDSIHNESLNAMLGTTAESTAEVRNLLTRTMEEDFALRPQIMDDVLVQERLQEKINDVRNELVKKYRGTATQFGETKVTALTKDGFTLETEVLTPGDQLATSMNKELAEAHADTGVTFTVTPESAQGPGIPERTTETQRITFAESNIGTFETVPDKNAVIKTLGSAKLRFTDKGHSTVGRVVEDAELLDSTSESYQRIFDEAITLALKPLGSKLRNKESWNKVESVLQASDEAGDSGVRFTPQQLMYEGVALPTGKVERLSQKEAQAYYNMLEISDFAYMADNIATRQAKVLQGFKAVKLRHYEDLSGKVSETTQSITGTLQSLGRNSRVFNTDSGPVLATDIRPKSLVEEGKVVVRLEEPIAYKPVEEAPVQYYDTVIVRASDISELPPLIKSRRDAYVPKINQNVRYIVKEHSPGTLNGQSVAVNPASGAGVSARAIRFFDSKKEAEAWAATRNEVEDSGKVFVAHQDRDPRISGDVSGTPGSVFSGPRSSMDIRFGTEGEQTERLPAFEAIMRNMQHLSNKLPRNEWRISMQQRFIDTANQQGLPDFKNFNDPLPKGFEGLEDLRDYINAQLRVPDKSEWTWEAFSRRTAEWMEGRPVLDANLNIPFKEKPLNLRRSVLNLGDKNPIGAARAAAFHSLLGWYNPAQLMVQGFGSTVALSRYPQHAPKALLQGAVLRATMFSTNEAYIRSSASKMGLNADEFVKMQKQFLRTGLRDSVRATADHAAAVQGYNFAARALRREADRGLRFYKEGEYFTRGTGWLIAREQWKAANPGKVVDEAAERAIFEESQNLMLNLSRANRAKWQEGIFSLGTQFLQVQAKMIEQLLPSALGGAKALTDKQRLKLLLGQGVIFGSAGIPFGVYLTNQVAGMLDIDPSEVTEEQLNFARQGVIGHIFGDNEVVIARRGAIAAELEDSVFGLFNEDKNFAEALFGAFGSTFSRGVNGIKHLAPLFTDQEWDGTDYAIFSSELLKVVSTYNNAERAYYMYKHQQYLDASGRVVAREFSPTEIGWQAFGFTPRRVEDVALMLKDERKRNKYRTKQAKNITSLIHKYLLAVDEGDASATDRIGKWIQIEIDSEKPSDRQAILRTISNSFKNPQTREQKAINKAIKDGSSEMADMLIQSQIYLTAKEKAEQ